MSILVIGGDKLGNIPDKLYEKGFSDVYHISGRKYGDRKINISCRTDIVLVLTDYIEHTITNAIKKKTKKQGVKVIFSKRSWCHIENNIKKCIKGKI